MNGARADTQNVPEGYVEKLEQGLWDLSRRADLAEAEVHYLRRADQECASGRPR